MQLDISGFESAAAAKAWARTEIDAAAGRARCRYLTTVPGQEATYTAKYQQAKDYIAADCPSDVSPYQWIAQEALRTGLSPQEAATRIKGLGDQWANVIGPAIEGLRIGGKDALDALATVPEILTHTRAVTASLESV